MDLKLAQASWIQTVSPPCRSSPGLFTHALFWSGTTPHKDPRSRLYNAFNSVSANQNLVHTITVRSDTERSTTAAAGAPDLGSSPLGRVQPRHEIIRTKAERFTTETRPTFPTVGSLIEPAERHPSLPGLGGEHGEGVNR